MKIMKKLFLFAAFAFCGLGAFAQEEVNDLTNRENRLSRDYLRPSLTTIYIHDGTENAKNLIVGMSSHVNNKFDINTLRNNVFMTSAEITSKADSTAAKETIEKIIADEKIGNQIMKNWFPNFDASSKGYSFEVLEQRGQFAATDNDVLTANASQRQSSMFELGEKLIDRSYVIAYFVKDATYTNNKGELVVQANVYPVVYKLDFNTEVMNNFYTNHYSNANGIDNCEFPVVFAAYGKDASKALKHDDGYDISDIYNELMVSVKEVNDFMAKVPIASTSPISAKIGTKENLYIDKRFDVVEIREKEDGTQYEKRIGCTRVKKVADNNFVATGATEELSRFYQFKGGRIREGQVLVENIDKGFSIGADISTSDISITADYRIGKTTGIPGLLVGLSVGVVSTSEEFNVLPMFGEGDEYILVDENNDEKESPILKAGLNISKEFNFMRNFVLTPTISGGVLFPTVKDENDEFIMDTYYVGGSIKLGYMVTHNAQVFVEGGYHYTIEGDIFKTFVKEENKPNPIKLGTGFKIYF